MVNEIKYLFPDAVIGVDVIFRDDGNGVYIDQWNLQAPEPTQAEIDVVTNTVLIQNAISHFDNTTAEFIENKVQAYNKANGVSFKNIDAFPKYAINTASPHYSIANQFIVYADNVWKAVRAYQATLTAIPTDAEFQSMLDGVTF